MNTRAFLLSVLIAGVFTGLLCIWVWLGGVFAVYLYRRYMSAGPALTPGQGAGLGAVVGFLVYLITGAPTLPFMGNALRALEIEGDIPFQGQGFAGIVIQGLVLLLIDLVLYPMFGTIAGLLGVNLL